ncbi:hypothetical protein AB4Z54_05585, partial [Streptomyces sp. MCAF7]
MQRLVEWRREFRIWHYTVSYSQLLLRSINVEGEESRIDVLFSNVGLMCVKSSFETLSIERVEIAEARGIIGMNVEFPDEGYVFL